MCRINGFWDFGPLSYAGQDVCERMRDSMQYGGPDAFGHFADQDLALFLGHRRLAVLDLSEAGHQPMRFKHWVLVFNGEIYNFQDIRQQLERKGRTFQSASDSEVLLQAWDEWGTAAVAQFRGMFAFAIWDTQRKTLTLCRDRLGVKPLYWYQKGALFGFASELKGLQEHPHFDRSIDQAAVSLFLQQGTIAAPHCIFQYAHKLQPGHFLQLTVNGIVKIWPYWEAQAIYEKGSFLEGREAELQTRLTTLLEESFQLRMIADVPIGVFLSGGIDSSLLTALLQKNSTRPLKTFTVGFEDQLYDEAPHAKAIAQHLGTDHTTLYCTDQDLRQLLPQLAYFCDEPFGDTSLFPTHLVAALARQEVTVALSADGADELFGGYTRYEVAYRWFPKMKVWPLALRKHLATLLAWVPPHWLERNKNYFPVLRNYQQLPHKIHKLQQALRAENQLEFFKAATAYNHRATLQPFLPHFQPRFANQSTKALPNRLLGLLGLLDITTYLEGDILAKVDRASMQVALEARDPFLDHHLVEFALALPDEFKIRNGSTKYLLRQILYQYVPRELLERPKQGFSLPMRKWLRTHFQDELKQMSTDSAFAETFQLYPQAIQQLVCRFLKPKTFVDHHLVWFLFVLFQWQKRWL